MARHRYRGLGVEHRGYTVAVVEEKATGSTFRVYKRLGKWRFYRDDHPVGDKALSGVARRLLG